MLKASRHRKLTLLDVGVVQVSLLVRCAGVTVAQSTLIFDQFRQAALGLLQLLRVTLTTQTLSCLYHTTWASKIRLTCALEFLSDLKSRMRQVKWDVLIASK